MKEGADKEFLSEAEELVENLGRDLLRYEDAVMAGGRINPDLLNGIFRAAHSLKGLAGMFGRQDMASIAHLMETLLDRMRLGKVPRDPMVLDVLFDAVEVLKNVLAAPPNGINTERIVKRLEDASEGKFAKVAPAVEEAPVAAAPVEAPKAAQAAAGADEVEIEGIKIPKNVIDVLTEYEEFRFLENIRGDSHIIKVSAGFDLTTFDTDLPDLMNWLKERGEVITTLPGSNDSEDDKLHFDLLVGTDEDIDALTALLAEKKASVSVIKHAGGPQAAPPKTPAAQIQGARPADPVPQIDQGGGEEHAGDEDGDSARSVSRTVRVDIKRLDNLMNIVGELVLEKAIVGGIRDQLRQEKGQRRLANELYKSHRNLDRKLAELQEAVMEVRMVPVGQLFGRLGRIVRKVARDEGKEIELIRSGSETELDKLIIEELADPLMHIIRNAIDHGIEPPGTRERHGKPRKGTIELRAFQQGNHVVIQVLDDGAGIDPKRVHAKAVKMGIISPGTDLKEDEMFHLLFEAGFSTKEEVSEISGRGVGLDVVKKNIANLSGMIDIDSVVGEGSTFTITIPITLAIIQALIVESAGRTYALPLNSVKECHILTASDIRTIEQREVMELREKTIPLLRLGVVFGHENGGNGNGKKHDAEKTDSVVDVLDVERKQFVVVVGIAEKRLGVLVDGLKGRQDVVIKSLGKTLGDIKGVAGATDLGNQQTVLVLDVGDLISEVAATSGFGAAFHGRA